MNSKIKQLEGLSSEDRYRILAETGNRYKSIIRELQDITESIDDHVSQTISSKGADQEVQNRSLLSIINLQSKLLTDVLIILNKLYNEHTVEIHYIQLNLEILNQNINMIYEKILKEKE